MGADDLKTAPQEGPNILPVYKQKQFKTKKTLKPEEE